MSSVLNNYSAGVQFENYLVNTFSNSSKCNKKLSKVKKKAFTHLMSI